MLGVEVFPCRQTERIQIPSLISSNILWTVLLLRTSRQSWKKCSLFAGNCRWCTVLKLKPSIYLNLSKRERAEKARHGGEKKAKKNRKKMYVQQHTTSTKIVTHTCSGSKLCRCILAYKLRIMLKNTVYKAQDHWCKTTCCTCWIKSATSSAI